MLPLKKEKNFKENNHFIGNINLNPIKSLPLFIIFNNT